MCVVCVSVCVICVSLCVVCVSVCVWFVCLCVWFVWGVCVCVCDKASTSCRASFLGWGLGGLTGLFF